MSEHEDRDASAEGFTSMSFHDFRRFLSHVQTLGKLQVGACVARQT